MAQIEEQIGNEIAKISLQAKDRTRFTISSGVVKSVNETDNTASVQLTIEDDIVDLEDGEYVLLNVFTGNKGGVYMVPAIDADCEVMEIDGPGKWDMIKASKYSKIVIQADIQIQFNDGSKGGLTITPELKTQLDKNNTLLSHLITIIKGSPITEPGSGAPSALQAALNTAIASDELADFSNIENTAIKQG